MSRVAVAALVCLLANCALSQSFKCLPDNGIGWVYCSSSSGGGWISKTDEQGGYSVSYYTAKEWPAILKARKTLTQTELGARDLSMSHPSKSTDPQTLDDNQRLYEYCWYQWSTWPKSSVKAKAAKAAECKAIPHVRSAPFEPKP